MKARILSLALLLPAAALLCWRVEWDSAFLPARLQNDMTERTRIPRGHVPGAIPFAGLQPEPSTPLLYRQYCAACHGEHGQTPPFLANTLGMPQIPHLSSTAPDSAAWTESISRGRGAMPAYATLLTPEQIEALVQHIPHLGQPESGVQPAPPTTPAPAPHCVAPATPPESPFAWGRTCLSFLISLPLGWLFQRGVMPRSAGQRPVSFERSLALTLAAAAAASAAGIALWGSAAFALPALSLAAGLSCQALLKRGAVSPSFPAMQITALAIAAYALSIPLLVGSYIPGASTPSSVSTAHALCLGALLVLAVALTARSWRTPRALVLHAVVVLLVLAGAHAVLGSFL